MLSLPLTLTTNPDGQPNLRHASGFIHSTRDPVKEARRFLNSINADTGTTVLVGVGWGYLASELTNQDAGRIILFEPIEEVVQILEENSRLPLLRKKARLATRLDELQAILKGSAGPIVFHIMPAYARLFPDLLRDISDRLGGGTDEPTRRRFLRQWTRNALRRLTYMESLPFLKTADSKPRGALIYIGAGPSLDRELDRLRELQDKAYLVAADTALAPLLHHGIEIDLVLSIDSGRGTLFHLVAAQRIRDQLPPLLTWLPGAQFIEDFFSDTAFYRSTFPLDQALAIGNPGAVPEFQNPTRNTVGLALIAAHALGCEFVSLAGTGFAREAGRSHARGTGYDDYARLMVSRTSPFEHHRPGIYSGKNDSAARTAFAGVEQLARDSSLKLVPLSDRRLEQRGLKPNRRLPVHQINTQALRADSRVQAALARVELPGDLMDRWRSRWN